MKLRPILFLLITAGSMTPPRQPKTLAPQTVIVVVDASCATAVHMGPKFECRGYDDKHLTCSGLVVSFKQSCERLEVIRGQ